jgi:pyruvate/2-oxoglutarate dehydrogenase complex dihydrolipoamide dehydrogenase (E3) component
MKTHDAIVIGSGQGGVPLATNLADQGWSVALIEKGEVGGSCINYGCTPTKTMISSARMAHYARVAPEFGIHPGEIKVDMAAVVARKNEIVDSFRSGVLEQIDSSPNVTLYHGHGRFTAPHEVGINGETLKSDKIFINTGTRPRFPALPGLDQVEVLTNRNIMDLQELPAHLIALGGSYLGLEFGQMFRRLGSEVTVVEMSDRIAAREDAEVSDSLREALEAEGMKFHLGSTATKVEKTADGLEVTVKKKDGTTERIEGTHLLMSIGQVPNSDDRVSTRQALPPTRTDTSSTMGSLRPISPVSGCSAMSRAVRPSPTSPTTTIL